MANIRDKRVFLVTISIVLLAALGGSFGTLFLTSNVDAGSIYIEEGIDTSGASGGATDIFLNIVFPGESIHPHHVDEIRLLGFNWGELTAGIHVPIDVSSGEQRISSKAVASEFHLIKEVDKSSAKLLEACSDGERLGEAVLSFHQVSSMQDPIDYLQIKLTDTICNSYSLGGAADQFKPNEHITLGFTSVEYKYQQQSEDGDPIGDPVEGRYRVEAGR